MMSRHNKVKICKYFLLHGALVNTGDNYGVTALMGACIVGNLFIAHLLHGRGADVNMMDIHGYTALMRTCSRGLTVVAIFLFG